MGAQERASLIFEGLDTLATIRLNGLEIGTADNMFLPIRIDVTSHLSESKANILDITFESAFLKGKQIIQEFPAHKWGCWNGDASRLAVRKAQYHYGWDWGPCLMSCGPWRPIWLEICAARLYDLCFTIDLFDGVNAAQVIAKVDIAGRADFVCFELSFHEVILARATANIIEGHASTTFTTQRPKLWYPRRYGNQPLYDLSAKLMYCDQVVDTVTKRFGVRKVRLVQMPLQASPGSSFVFEINGIPIWCGGSNWIPADSFLTRVTPQKYRDWVHLAAAGHQTMLRVWGGGIYESDDFYDACDEQGILVWQDFMFACGNYPTNESFLLSVGQEAVANVKRLRHHPCIVLYAGNNEDYQYAESTGLRYDPEEKDPQKWLRSDFPARFIYEKVLKDIVHTLTPGTAYHPGSPFGGTPSSDPATGDLHQWNVWHGSSRPYQDFDMLAGRFVSEFGMQALPDARTMDRFFEEGGSVEKYPASSTVSYHNKAAGHDRRLATYMAENLRYRFAPFWYYIYCTQVLQAECVATAFRSWKRLWQGPSKRYCGGALVWQINDCWPCTSWAIIDSEARPKLAYYALKREMRTLTLGMKRYSVNDGGSENRIMIDVWVCNFGLDTHAYYISVASSDLETGCTEGLTELNRRFSIQPNCNTELIRFCISDRPSGSSPAEQVAICATLTSEHRTIIARSVNWPEPLRYTHLPQAAAIFVDLVPRICEGPGPASPMIDLFIMCHVPLKGVYLQFDDQDNKYGKIFDDNGFDYMPASKGQKPHWHRIMLSGIDQASYDRLRITYLNCEESAAKIIRVSRHESPEAISTIRQA